MAAVSMEDFSLVECSPSVPGTCVWPLVQGRRDKETRPTSGLAQAPTAEVPAAPIILPAQHPRQGLCRATGITAQEIWGLNFLLGVHTAYRYEFMGTVRPVLWQHRRYPTFIGFFEGSRARSLSKGQIYSQRGERILLSRVNLIARVLALI